MQREYDKAVMALSGGAFGVSLAFLKDVLGEKELNCTQALLAAWICWGASVTATLFSYYTSTVALRRAVKQTDDREVYLKLLGGPFNLITKTLNVLGGVLFLAGVLSIVFFVSQNISTHAAKPPTTPAATATATPFPTRVP